MNAHSLASLGWLTGLVAVAALLSACSFGLDFGELEPCPDHAVVDEATGDCACAEGFVENAVGACVCPEFSALDASGACVCASPRAFDQSGACACDTASGFETNAAGQCSCPDDRQVVDGVCVCRPGAVELAGVCQCDAAAGFEPNSAGQCVCPEGQSVVDGVCACPSGTVQSGGRCECDTNAGFEFDALSGTCICADDHFVDNDGVCGCPPLLVENEAGDACVCPEHVPTEGGPIAISASRDTCNGFLNNVGVLGSGGRTLVDLVVVEEIPDMRWRIAVLERLTQSLRVSVHVIGLAADGTFATQEVGSASGPIESLFEGYTEEALAGIALVYVDDTDELVPIVAFSRAAPRWADLSRSTIEPLGNPDVWVTAEEDPPDSGMMVHKDGLETYRATGWVDPQSKASAMIFHGTQLTTTGSPWVVGAARFSRVGETLDVDITVTPLPVDELFTRNGDDFDVALLDLGAITPVVNLSGVFVTAGAMLRGTYTATGCTDGSEACVNWGADGNFGEPQAVELEYDASTHAISARLATDTVDYSAAKDQVVAVLAELVEAENGDGDPDLSPDHVVFRPAGITGQGGELVAIARPFYFGCFRPATADMPASVNDCSDPSTSDLPGPVELFGPTAAVTYSRSAQAFRAEAIAPAQDVIVQRVSAVDAEELGLDPSVRLLALTFENPTSDTHVLALGRISALDRPDVLYEFQGPSIDVFGGPQMFAAGPFLFLETAVGVRVLAVSALSAE